LPVIIFTFEPGIDSATSYTMQKLLKETVLLISGFLFPCMVLFAQIPQTIDSLEKLLPKATEIQRVDVLNELAWNYKFIDQDKCREFAEESAGLASKISYPDGLAYAQRNLGVYYFVTNNYPESEKYLLQCIQTAKEYQLNFHEAKALNLLGIISREKLDYSTALEYHQAALTIYQQLSIDDEIAGVLSNMAMVYELIHESDKALETYLEVLEKEEASGNTEGIARTNNNLGYSYFKTDDYGKSIIAFTNALEAAKKVGNNNFLASAYHGLGVSFHGLGNFDAAITNLNLAANINKIAGNDNWLANNFATLVQIYMYKKNYQTASKLLDTAILIYEQNNRTVELIGALNIKGMISFDLGDFSTAEKFFRKSIGISDTVDVLLSKEAYNNLYHLEKRKGNYQTALQHLEKALQLSDSLDKVVKSKTLMEIGTRYEVKQKDAENLHLKSLNELNKRIILNQRHVFVGAGVFVVFLSVLIVVLFRGKKRLKMANLELQRKSAEILSQSGRLTELNATKDRLFSIIAHDLKNPFNAILGFSEIAIEEVEKYDDRQLTEIIGMIKNSADGAYKLLENLLEWSRSQRGILGFNPDWINVKESLEELISLSNNQAQSKMISIGNNVPQGFWIFADQNMFETMLRNLVGNAIKFTHPNGVVAISAIQENGYSKIIITDNGVGMSKENVEKLFRIDQGHSTKGTGNESGSGLGLILCKEFIEKHHGFIEVESTKDSGSRFSLSFPIPNGKN
jgi:signal transduction histidine kinase/Flp pilus assembly protein TadD